MKPLH
ncbi:Protein of unknown function [Pyronema omphalodes CBS 100304]